MPISPTTLQAVRQSICIEEVVADFVALKKRGKNLWACCPFHQEKHPSFAVYPSKGFYKCFGCGVAGDAITFVREISGKSFAEAVSYLAQKYGIEVQESAFSKEQGQAQNERDSLYILLSLAKEYYVQTLWKQSEGQSVGLHYFQNKGLSSTCIKHFELGYALDTWQGFRQFAQEKGYEDTLLEKAGLIIQQGNRVYDRFRGRMIFPIHNIFGQVIAFGARRVQEKPNQPKYINSPETLVYHKHDILYGVFQAKDSIREADHCYLVEGYTDVLSMHMAHITNVVAASGTSLTKEQVWLVSRFTKHITLVFDGDQAGIKAALRSIDLVLEMGLHVKVVVLPEGDDPDSHVRRVGASAFQTYLKESSQDFIRFKTKLLLQAAQEDPVRKAEAIREIVGSIAIIPDAVTRTVLVQQCSRLLGIDEVVLTAEQNKLIAQKERTQIRRVTQRSRVNNVPMVPTSRNSLAHALEEGIKSYERESIRMLLNYGKVLLANGEPLYTCLLRELEEVDFCSPEHKAIMKHFQDQLVQGRIIDASYAFQDEGNLKKTVIDLVASPYEISTHWEDWYQIATSREEDTLDQAVLKNVLRLKFKLIQQLLEANRAELKNNPSPEEEQSLLSVHASLKQSELSIAQQLGIVVW